MSNDNATNQPPHPLVPPGWVEITEHFDCPRCVCPVTTLEVKCDGCSLPISLLTTVFDMKGKLEGKPRN